jgi:hypothetical protein
MHVDADKIISDSKKVFLTSDIQKQKYYSLTGWIDENEYRLLHPNFLNPLDIKINPVAFEEEIVAYNDFFEQWGNEHIHLPRYGLALVNQTGSLHLNDVVNGSLYEYNFKNPTQPLLETDFAKETEVMNLESLAPLREFNGNWLRSNILYWKDGAHFKPHIDTVVPTPWIRLWGTTSKNIKLRYAVNDMLVDTIDVEPGRIYALDTSIVHDARCEGASGYQFFLSCCTGLYERLRALMI